ncbi:hypothetical protein [Chitinasiproducens palmae]|uniref:Uncharacterized protein n=1 Tax=Chitinasiproducens palmae TaxID=1770053 RepID=A0A1H2PS54_9BURK|nr:hypothetical protein [Chitinasiproducens palmae]SDV49783.1 hypothetical protein SAMN05216551_109131 [Chitinasiproducens palmae]
MIRTLLSALRYLAIALAAFCFIVVVCTVRSEYDDVRVRVRAPATERAA